MVLEFPKMIYRNGDQTAEWLIVATPEALEEAKGHGFFEAGKAEEVQPKRKAGRPRKED